MRKLVCLLFVLFYAGSLAAKPGPGIIPKRGKGKKRNDSFIGNAITSHGPTYSTPDAPPPTSAIPGLIAASDPNSPNSIVSESMGLSSGGNCQGIQARAQTLIAQLNEITAKVLAEQQAILGCGGGIAGANCAIAHANTAIALGNQAIPIAAELQTLQAQAATCGSSGGSSAQAMPPGVTLANMAKRFNVALASAPGGGSGTVGGGLAMQQLEKLASEGEGADWDGRHSGEKLAKAMSHYGDASKRASHVGRLVHAGREAANSKLRYDDPGDVAQNEYLKINYKELGPKYEALAEERHQAADNVAAQALNSLSSPAPLPDMEGGSEIKVDESKAVDLGGAGAYVDKAGESLGEGMKDALVGKLSLQWQSLEKIVEIDMAVGKAWDLRGELSDALHEMGSLSQSTVATDKLLASLSKYFGDVKDAAFEKNPLKSALGAD